MHVTFNFASLHLSDLEDRHPVFLLLQILFVPRLVREVSTNQFIFVYGVALYISLYAMISATTSVGDPTP